MTVLVNTALLHQQELTTTVTIDRIWLDDGAVSLLPTNFIFDKGSEHYAFDGFETQGGSATITSAGGLTCTFQL